MTKSAIKYVIKETPARLRLAGLIDQQNVVEEQMRGLQGRGEITQQQSQIAIGLRDVDASVRLAVIDVILEEAQSVVAELDSAAKAFVRRVGTSIHMLDDFIAITKASGCGHHALQAAYAGHDRLNREVDKIGANLLRDMNQVAAEAAVSKWLGAPSVRAGDLAELARELLTNPMATLENGQ